MASDNNNSPIISSDSDDDLPIAQLRSNIQFEREKKDISITLNEKNQIIKQEIKTEHQEEIVPSTNERINLSKRNLPPPISDDDDVPINKLKKKVKQESKDMNKDTKKIKMKSDKVGIKTETNGKNKPRPTIKYRQQECTEELYGTLKGQLTQELLCRWWYAIDWPDLANSNTELHGMQELDGFRGAYIRVKGDDMGSIVDTRNSLNKPCFLNFFAMPAAKLQELLVQAYKKQMEVLIEHEGENAPLLKELRKSLQKASKISPEKAEKSVIKVLKKYKDFAVQVEEIQLKIKQES